MQCTRRDFTRNVSLIAAGCLAGIPLLATTSYTVRDGDTLGHIALRHGVSTTELRRANKLSSDLIRVGQKLQIPAEATHFVATVSDNMYLVQRGDTLGSIALTHGISLSDLKRANHLSSDMIRIGQKLQVPNAIATEDLLAKVRAETANIHVRSENWKRIVVHHSAIKYGNAAVYDRAHRKRGMQNGLAYHFVIGNGIDSGDGEIEIGPRWKKQLLGGHVKSYRINLTAIGICLVGNFQATHPTRRQLAAFTQLMDWLRADVIPGAKHFAGHRDQRGEQTICPGKNFPLAAMRARYD
jgi:LysM repeat protein